MVSLGVVKTTMDILYKPDSTITKLLVMLLVNLTQMDAGIASLLQVSRSLAFSFFFFGKNNWVMEHFSVFVLKCVLFYIMLLNKHGIGGL